MFLGRDGLVPYLEVVIPKPWGYFAMKNAIWESWEMVCGQYRNGRINSERTMQAFFFRFLQDAVPDRTVLCEAGFEMAAIRAIPDILVIEAGKVVAAVELKFVPHGYPVFEDDLQKLAYYAKHTQSFPLTLDPLNGRFSSVQHNFAEDCLLVFGAIGRFDADAVDSKRLQSHMVKMGEFGDRFMALTCPVGTKDAA
ncbi:MAG TPA: hypothetical protein VH374_09945 [Polyangia bacterium]|jgi:hypothetical protein|nr:hypothetical protein [Polyangia bacterium]